MNRASRPEVLDLHQRKSSSADRARSRSCHSVDNNPLSSNASSASISANPLLNITPEPAYIAASAAARLVTSDHEGFFRNLHDDGIIGSDSLSMFVSEGSLLLVNQFLDFLLFSFLTTAKSMSLASLRPAVTEILRVRLAKEALAGADQELRSYLGGEDESDHLDVSPGGHTPSEWDLVDAWRKARVQCMVYSSLGDLEEDDEAFYSESGLEGAVGLEQYQRQSSILGVISPAVAIWLTSILEFIGEQTLLVAGHASIARYSAQRIAAATNDDSSDSTFPARPTVEELDTEKVALNPSLGRMWRQWRKKVRGGRGSFSVPNREGVYNRLERQASLASRISDAASIRREDEASLRSAKSSLSVKSSSTATDEKRRNGSVPSLKESTTGMLTPVVETASPGRKQDKARDSVSDDGGDEDSSVNKPRPQSLIIIPWTHVPPFVFNPSPTPRRPRSLPDLQRGDFADPGMDGKESVEEQMLDDGTPIDEAAVIAEDGIPDDDYWEEREIVFTASITSHDGTKEYIEVREVVKPRKTRDVVPRQSVALEPVNIVASVEQSQPLDEIPAIIEPPLSATGPGRHSARPGKPTVEELVGGYTTIEPEDEEQGLEARQPERAPKVASKPHRPRTSSRDHSMAKLYEQATTKTVTKVNIISRPSEELHSTAHVRQAPSSASSTHSQLSDRKPGQITLVQTASNSSDRSGGRVFTPPATPDRSRRSSSFSKTRRPTTSGSTPSQTSAKLKKIIRGDTETGKHTKSESDTESRSSLHSERLASMDEKERSFEELISGGGTIHYTITPDPIRNIEGSPPPIKKRTVTSDLADFLRNTGPDGVRAVTSHSTRSLGANRGQIPRSTPARDIYTSPGPLTQDPSIASYPPVPSVQTSTKFTSSSKAQRMLGGSNASSSAPGTPHIPSGEHSPRIPEIPSVLRKTRSGSLATAGINTSRAKNRLQARDASGNGDNSNTTSALADFFRNTNPPTEAGTTGHRISRSVAPFRNTMDSAQFDPTADADLIEEAGPRTRKESSYAPTASTTTTTGQESYSSSFTSSTALLPKSTANYGSTANRGGPQRKQVRNKDPYAIDLDGLESDDEDLELLGLALPKKKEESLIDFLKNAPPPPPEPAPIVIDKTLQKKSSSVSLMSRFGRSASRKNSISSNMDKITHSPPPQSSVGAKYVPLPVSQGSDMSSQTRPSYSSHSGGRAEFGSQYPAMQARRPPHTATSQSTQYTARGGRMERGETDSLAEFLKHTGPPVNRAPSKSRKDEPEESQSVFRKMAKFSRSKKVAGVV